MKGQKGQGGCSLEGEVEEVGRGLVTGSSRTNNGEPLENLKLEKMALAAMERMMSREQEERQGPNQKAVALVLAR